MSALSQPQPDPHRHSGNELSIEIGAPLSILRTDKYDPIAYRSKSLKWSVTEGAEAIEKVLTLSELREILEGTPGCTAVVSDIHGYDQLLSNVLQGIGAISPRDERQGDFRLVSLGDLADGRCITDLETLQLSEKYFDEIIVGNHEAALMGGPTFKGLPGYGRPEVSEILQRLAWTGKLTAAVAVGDILLTHAGLSSQFLPEVEDPAEIAKILNEYWHEFLGRRSLREPLLFQVGSARVGDAAAAAASPASGGILWEDWEHLAGHHSAAFRQIVGHSPIRSPERSKDALVHALDLAGYRVGVAVITPSFQIHFGSDFSIPVG